jgi:hypothetical protein
MAAPLATDLPLASHPSNFNRTELQRALAEQSSCISSFELETLELSTPQRTTACVIRLEGNKLTISLSSHGYRVSRPSTRLFSGP